VAVSDSGPALGCGITTETGQVRCWSDDNSKGQLSTPTDADLRSLTVESLGACALRSTNAPVCWGEGSQGHTALNDKIVGHAYKVLSSSHWGYCGIELAGSLRCAGWPEVPAPPSGTFKQVDVGSNMSCAIRVDDTVTCWRTTAQGSDLTGTWSAAAPAGAFTTVDVGEGHACGVRSNGAVVCWGSNSVGQVTVPAKLG
jgi:hypothetical protein